MHTAGCGCSPQPVSQRAATVSPHAAPAEEAVKVPRFAGRPGASCESTGSSGKGASPLPQRTGASRTAIQKPGPSNGRVAWLYFPVKRAGVVHTSAGGHSDDVVPKVSPPAFPSTGGIALGSGLSDFVVQRVLVGNLPGTRCGDQGDAGAAGPGANRTPGLPCWLPFADVVGVGVPAGGFPTVGSATLSPVRPVEAGAAGMV